jgi:hypothetical protein
MNCNPPPPRKGRAAPFRVWKDVMPRSVLAGPIPASFEEFYRSKLRFASGGRIRALDLFAMYSDWAAQEGKPALNQRQIRRAMVNIGHRHFRSNITFFGDVQLASEASHLDDNFPAMPPITEAAAAAVNVLGQIEQLALAVEQLRRTIGQFQLN